MRVISLLFFLFSCMFMTSYGQDLRTHQWQQRVLIVKSNTKNSKVFKKQILAFENNIQGFEERRLVLYKIIDNQFTYINYSNPSLNTNGQVSKSLIKKLNPKEDFEVLLIGLDGGIKLRQEQLLTQEKLFATIDAMPMRRSEIRH